VLLDASLISLHVINEFLRFRRKAMPDQPQDRQLGFDE
jgi:hypothetical protein